LSDDEIMDYKPAKNRNGNILKKPGRPKKKDNSLNPKQERFVEEYLKSGNASKAKETAGYSKNTPVTDILNNPKISNSIEEHRKELWEDFKEYSQEMLELVVEIARNEDASFKTRLDACIDILDRAGYKPAERREITGANGGSIMMETQATLTLAQRARELLEKKEPINITGEVIGEVPDGN